MIPNDYHIHASWFCYGTIIIVQKNHTTLKHTAKHPEIRIPSSLLKFVVPNLFLPRKIKEKNVSTVFVYEMKVSGSKTTRDPSDFQCIDKNAETFFKILIL